MWRSLIRIINYHVLKQIAQCGYNNIYIKTDSKRTANTHGPRMDEERIVNGLFRFIKRPVPFRFIKRQREVFLQHTVGESQSSTCSILDKLKVPTK